MKQCLLASCLLLAGCGVSVTTSGIKAGIISEEVVVVDNGSRVVHEDLIGLRIQWLPYFSWNDVVGLFKSDKKNENPK